MLALISEVLQKEKSVVRFLVSVLRLVLLFLEILRFLEGLTSRRKFLLSLQSTTTTRKYGSIVMEFLSRRFDRQSVGMVATAELLPSAHCL